VKIKNLVTVQTGSHLYNLAQPNSDLDLYTVYRFLNKNYRPRRQVTQHIEEETDHVKISLDRFYLQLAKGVPQACEVVFAKSNFYLDVDEAWYLEQLYCAQIIEDNLLTILDTYRRTVLNFFATDDLKKNRHGFRLLLNAEALRDQGWFNPTLTNAQAQEVTSNASLPWKEREDLFKDRIWSVFR